jgi:hypothetical protein
MFTTNGKKRTYPDNSDYLLTIQELSRELKCPIVPTWVKGHQDDDRPYDELPREARLNIDVDELATKQCNSTTAKHKPMRRIDHLPCQQVSLSINGTRFPSHWDTNLRWYINGSYMKEYVMSKHGWDIGTWNTIDFEFVKAYCRPTKGSPQVKWFKFMHNLQALGIHKQKMNRAAAAVNIAICPCCQQHPETQEHMILCGQNPHRAQALLELSTGGSTFKEHHSFIEILTDCIEQWVINPARIPSIANILSNPTVSEQDPLPPHFVAMLQVAIQEQTVIGWVALLQGYISKQWRQMASSHMLNAEAPAQPMDGRRRLDVILHRVQGYVLNIWKGRNEMLHRKDQYDEQRFLSNEAAEIRHYFSQPHLLPVQDQHYCTGQVISILRGSPATRRRWLMRVRRARAAQLQDQLRQARITSYFHRTKQSAATLNSDTSISISKAIDTRKYTERRGSSHSITFQTSNNMKQTNLHHYFPGRPPDFQHETENSINTKSPALP